MEQIGENPIDYDTVEEITLSGNSYGKEACEYIASLLEKETPKLTKINFNDIFVGRKLDELPKSLEVLAKSIKNKKIEYLDLSHNAFGPAGISSFDFLLKEMSTLKVLKITNCGLGPEGGEMIANALKENKELKLEQFSAGRDRLENKGIKRLSEVFSEMKSLKVIEIPQNGIKKEGMLSLMEALKANFETLREVYIHDNWIKNEAVDKLVEFLLKSNKLERLNISDSDMGNEAVLLIMKAMKESPCSETLKEFHCNYNEVECSKTAAKCFHIILAHLPKLELFEFKGHGISNKTKKEFTEKFKEANKTIVFKEDDESE